VELLYNLAEAIARFLDTGPGLVASLIFLMIASIPAIVLHELGHAIAARRLLGVDVQVSVGSAGKLAEMRLGQIALSINALSHPGRIGGAAEFDGSRATARDVLLIALAGPAASLAGTIGTALALSAVSTTGALHDLLWVATLVGVTGVLNLVPLRFQERRHGPTLRTDGRLALDALRVARALRD
jgi:membrane-associated protease RseP (regulator of RpoE activity)